MATILELNPQDFARSQQGSCIMTATDTTTGIKEPFALFDGRASGRTAVGRDGLIYDVLPYEPAFTLVDGKMVLSEEPLATNLIQYSYDFSQWGNSFSGTGDAVVITPNATTSPKGLNDAYRLDFNLNGGNTSSDSSLLSLSYNATNGQELTTSVWVKSADSNEYLIALDSDSQQSNIITVTNEWQRLDTTRVGANTGSRTAKIGLRGSFGTSDNATVFVYESQLEEGNIATSNISTNGATETRLAATGVKTPDISKWINSEDIVFRVKAAAITNGGGNRRISLNDSTTSNRIGIIYFGAGTEVVLNLFVNSSQIVNTVVNIGNHTDLNDMVFVVQSGNIKFFNNGTKLREQQNVFSFSSDISNITFFTPSSGNEPFYANVDTLQVMDYNTAIQEGLTYIND